MSRYQIHDLNSAPEKSKPILEKVKGKFGFIPNLLGGLAESPVAAEAYPTLDGIFSKSSLSATEQQVVLMTANYENGCDYCMAAHSTIAQGQKVPQTVIDGLRDNGDLGDPKLEALRAFARNLIEKRGHITQDEFQSFIDAGYTREQALDVVVGLAQKVISNYGNRLIETPVDDAFQSNAWQRPVGAGA